jgi:hypothetical protein
MWGGVGGWSSVTVDLNKEVNLIESRFVSLFSLSDFCEHGNVLPGFTNMGCFLTSRASLVSQEFCSMNIILIQLAVW